VIVFSIRQEQNYLELFPTAYPLSLLSVLSIIYTYHSLTFHPTLNSQDKTLKDNTGSGVVEVLSANTTINVAVPDALIGSIFGKQVQNLLPSSSHLALSLETQLYRFTLTCHSYSNSILPDLHHFSLSNRLPLPLFSFIR
jgi:hypothetical protein